MNGMDMKPVAVEGVAGRPQKKHPLERLRSKKQKKAPPKRPAFNDHDADDMPQRGGFGGY